MFFEPEMKVVLVETNDVVRTSKIIGDMLPDDEF